MVTHIAPVFRRPPDERGTAIFIVVLVMTLLTGIGLFAARITGSVDAATGNARQSAQARALAIYAAQLAPGALALDKESINTSMDAAKSSAAGTQCPANRYLSNVECAVRNHYDLAEIAKRSIPGVTLLDPQANATDGSLGPRTGIASLLGIEGNLRLEYFERSAAPPTSGNSKGSNGASPSTPLEYAITASAQIRPIIGTASPEWCSPDNQTANANVQAVRLYVTVP